MDKIVSKIVREIYRFPIPRRNSFNLTETATVIFIIMLKIALRLSELIFSSAAGVTYVQACLYIWTLINR